MVYYAMGVKKLNKFLSEKHLIKEYSSINSYVNVHLLNNKCKSIFVAVDFWLYAHKFTYSYGNIIVGFWNQVSKLLSHRIIPIYILDGTPPAEKSTVINDRYNKKLHTENKIKDICNEITEEEQTGLSDNITALELEKNRLEKSVIHITKNDIDNIKHFFDSINIPYICANSEADYLCAKLYKDGVITACLSDDMDMLPLGCGKNIKIINGAVYEYNLDYILGELKLSYHQFVDMCILFGCDYVKLPFKLDIYHIYELIIKYGSITNILNDANHEIIFLSNPKLAYFVANYENARNIYFNAAQSEINHNTKLFYITPYNEIDPFIVIKYLKIFGQNKYAENNIDIIMKNIEYINNLISNNVFCV